MHMRRYQSYLRKRFDVYEIPDSKISKNCRPYKATFLFNLEIHDFLLKNKQVEHKLCLVLLNGFSLRVVINIVRESRSSTKSSLKWMVSWKGKNGQRWITLQMSDEEMRWTSFGDLCLECPLAW
ncbi:AAEL009270-PA [Aedes aegypti]|uniref:AAEL009270-PA n=1 Tax=Aedes aegypti TaxID=7159 RepID=Q16WB6_AEDAE|nr:AAEL009270-PA [Aedes aegypti]